MLYLFISGNQFRIHSWLNYRVTSLYLFISVKYQTQNYCRDIVCYVCISDNQYDTRRYYRNYIITCVFQAFSISQEDIQRYCIIVVLCIAGHRYHPRRYCRDTALYLLTSCISGNQYHPTRNCRDILVVFMYFRQSVSPSKILQRYYIMLVYCVFQAISITQEGKPEEKLELAFRLYDIDRNGTIEVDEMAEIIKVIFFVYQIIILRSCMS